MTTIVAIGTWQLILVLFILLILFGTKLPRIARSLGEGITEFKKGINKGSNDDSDDEPKRLDDDDRSPPRREVKPGSEAKRSTIDDTSV